MLPAMVARFNPALDVVVCVWLVGDSLLPLSFCLQFAVKVVEEEVETRKTLPKDCVRFGTTRSMLRRVHPAISVLH